MLQTRNSSSANITGMVGEKIRKARQMQQLSLAEVASKADISVATLSRIETSKQPLEFGLFLVLANVLGVSPHSLISENGEHDGNGDGVDPLIARIFSLAPDERAQMWRDMTANRRARREARAATGREFAQRVEELVAQIDYLREEINGIRVQIAKRKSK